MSKCPEVTEAMTVHVANLARLELSESDVKTFTTQIRDVLNYVDTLQAVDVSKVEPMYHPIDQVLYMRDDVAVQTPKNAEGKPKVLDSAPEVLDDGYKVPPIL
jgi:aspartyl-tRNA(Asn)/glutamyl-tRNA(Gln) amidotransferase subunit C